MKNLIDKLMAHFGYYTCKSHYDLFTAEVKKNAEKRKVVSDFPVEKAPAKKKPAVRKATTRTLKKEK